MLDALGGYGGRFDWYINQNTAFFSATKDSRADRNSPQTHPTILHGWIDNHASLARQLGAAEISQAAIYSAALSCWGGEADNHISGNYAAISIMPGGGLRLVRSAWDAPPLYYALVGGALVVSPLLRVLFAGGAEKHLDQAAIIDQLAAAETYGSPKTIYRNVSRVSLGHAVTITDGKMSQKCWYDPQQIPSVRYASDEEYAARALELLGEAASGALAQTAKPTLALSGGLDSPIVATALLDAMPGSSTLDTITFRPDPDWSGTIIPGIMGDEAPYVTKFAEMHPRIRPHFSDRIKGGFDHKSREMAAAMQLFAPGLANIGMFHGVFAKAKELGCEWLFTADLANQSFSNDGRWAYVEYARSGKWGELVGLLRARRGDARPLWRKLLALSVLPQLPVSIQNRIRGIVHPARQDMLALLTPLSKQALQTHRSNAADRHAQSGLGNFSFPRSRQEAALRDHAAEDGSGADVSLAFEQLYGVRRRDVTAYRPLIEFCIGLPTEQFASGGEERSLARQMAKGRMPEAQRLNTQYGQHNIDWITRIGRNRQSHIAACHTMRDHPLLSQIIDLDRIIHLLEVWPDSQTFDIDTEWPRMFAIPQAILIAQFVGMAEGRNDL